MSLEPLTRDAFLGGRLNIWQPQDGYRAGTDPVFLASSVRPKGAATVLELGCGVGVASLCLGARVPGLKITGVELQPDYADLAERNALENGVKFEVVRGDVEDLPLDVRQRSFDHVIANPPYFEAQRMTPPQDTGKEIAHIAQAGTLSAWVEVGVKRLAPKGVITLVHLTESLPDILGIVSQKCGEIEIYPIVSRGNRPASRVIVSARKGSRTPLVLHPPKVVHANAEHGSDGDDYAKWAKSVLRDGASLF